MNCTLWRAALLGFTLCAACTCDAAVTAQREGDQIVLRNNEVQITINLAKGGSISDYQYAPFKGNIATNTYGGLLYDHVWEQTWPGEFFNRHYQGEILQAGPGEAAVKVWTTGEGASVKGLRLEREMRLREGDRALRCTVRLVNTTTEGRTTGYWSQSVFWFGESKEGMVWHQPTSRGVSHDGWFVDDFTAGWLGVTSSLVHGGLIFLMDYNDLFRLYPNAYSSTTEWMYDKVGIPAGKTWSTDFAVIPVGGIDGFTYGSQHLLANLVVKRTPGGLEITHQLSRSVEALKNVRVQTRVWGLKQTWTAVTPEVRFPELTEAVQSATVYPDGVGGMPAGVSVTVTGTDDHNNLVTEQYGNYFGGEYGANIEMRDGKPILIFPRPPKQKVYLKPDVIRYTPHARARVLFLRGFASRFFRVDEAIHAAFPDAEIVDGWLDQSPVGLLLSYFPADYDDLLSYDLIVLGNLPAQPLDLIGQEMLTDYVKAGGNLLLLGGDQAFGQADFTNAGLIAQLPVQLGGKYNWRKIPGGGALRVTAESPVTKEVTFTGKEMVYYSHLCTPKANAVTVVSAGDRPILVLNAAPDTGRVACVLATPFGEAAQGETAFWDAPAWQTLMSNTVRWLIRPQ
jgi:uncharacterized membrane protein